MTLYFGSHMTLDKSYHTLKEASYDILVEMAEKLKKRGGNIIQLMLPLHGKIASTEISENDFEKFKKYLIKNKMKIVLHSLYTHNLAKDWDEHSFWIKEIELEIKYAHLMGAIGLVIHLGKQMDLSLGECYNNMYGSLIYIHKQTKEYDDVKIILETPTGQGSQLCYKMQDLAYFYKKFSKNINKEIKKRIKLCIDTCHIFTAGYDIRTANKVKMYLEAFDELIGLKYVMLIHMNDSKVPLGSQVDRHERIGEGKIGLEGLVTFFNYFYNIKVPIILETPDRGYKTEINLLLDEIRKSK